MGGVEEVVVGDVVESGGGIGAGSGDASMTGASVAGASGTGLV